MTSRFDKLGIKQTIQKAWMDRTLEMVLSGMPEREIRAELDGFLSTQKQSGGVGERGKKTYGMALATLASWFAPDDALAPFVNDSIGLARRIAPNSWLSLHWAVVSANYPFWFNVAKQTGRLLNLQDQISQPQIFSRLKEQYGDRETVARNARYTVRSFVSWDVLVDSDTRGCYEKSSLVEINDPNIAGILIESVLLTLPTGKGSLSSILSNPGLFPFQIYCSNGELIASLSERVEVNRLGLDEDMLTIIRDK